MITQAELMLWFAGVAGNLVLFLLLVFKKQWPRYPVFTLLAAFEVLRAILLFLVSRHATHYVYSATYWISEVVDVFIQLLLLWEIAVSVFGYLPMVKGLPISARIPMFQVIMAFLIAGICPILLPPLPLITDTIDMRASVFTATITCELYVLIARRANRMALARTESILAISNGVTFWSVVSISSIVVQEIRGWDQQSRLFDEIRSCAVVVMLAYWVQHFSRSKVTNWLADRTAAWLRVALIRTLIGFSKSA